MAIVRVDAAPAPPAADTRPLSLRKLFDNAPELVLVLSGPEHVVEYANPAYQRFIGERELIGRRYREALADIAGQGYADLLDRVYRTGEPFIGREMPTAMQRQGEPAEVRYFDFVYQPLTDDAGRVDGIIGQSQDVTERVLARAALADSEERLERAARASRVGIWEWRLDTGEMIYSEEAKAILGFPPGEPVTLELVRAATHPEDLPRTQAQSQRARDPAIRDVSPFEYRIVRPDGSIRWVYARGEAVFEARHGREEAVRYVGTIQDITARREAEERLRASEAKLRLAMDAGRIVVWESRPGQETEITPELLRLFGFPVDASPSLEEIRAGYLPGERQRINAAAQAALDRGERSVETEFRYRQPSGDVRWFLVRADLDVGEGGALTGGIGVLVDVTERRRAEEQATLLAREVDHRANNLLTVVQGLVSFSKAEGDESLRRVILGRLEALSQAHQLLAASRWQGADLGALVREEMAPFHADDRPRVEIDGPAVTLSPAEAQALAMTLHELSTNAVKHGALSVEEGAVSIRWTLEADGGLVILWREQGGPPVGPPRRRGFGSTLIERAVLGLPDTRADIDWLPGGVVCRISLSRRGGVGGEGTTHDR